LRRTLEDLPFVRRQAAIALLGMHDPDRKVGGTEALGTTVASAKPVQVAAQHLSKVSSVVAFEVFEKFGLPFG
jgi:hypothetical protein